MQEFHRTESFFCSFVCIYIATYIYVTGVNPLHKKATLYMYILNIRDRRQKTFVWLSGFFPLSACSPPPPSLAEFSVMASPLAEFWLNSLLP